MSINGAERSYMRHQKEMDLELGLEGQVGNCWATDSHLEGVCHLGPQHGVLKA